MEISDKPQVQPIQCHTRSTHLFVGRPAEYSKANDSIGAQIALQIPVRIAKHKIRDWRTNQDAINRMRGEIDDILFEIGAKNGVDLPVEEHDAIIDRCIEVAIANED